MSIFGGNTHAPKAVLDAARSIMRGEEIEEMSSKEKMKRGLYNSFMIPEEIPTNEKTAFHGAAAAAHKAGKKNFEFQGKMYPVTMQKDAAHAIASEETIQEAADLDADNAEKAIKHDCATHVTSEKFGEGTCISGMHTIEEQEDGTGIVTHYDVMFEHGIEEMVPVSELKITKSESHMHAKKKMKEAVDVDAGNVEKALKHDCATHIQHEEHGIGRCIPGMHTLEQVDEENGVVTHYDVMFENDEGPYIVENVPVAEMKVLKDMNHGHKKKKTTSEGYAGNYGSSVSSYNREKDHEKRYEKENPGKRWKDLSWGHQQSHSAEYDRNPK